MITHDTKFYQYIDFLINLEGGLNDKIVHLDPGGLTNFGVRYKYWKKHIENYGKHDHYLQDRWDKFHSYDENNQKFFDINKFTTEDFRSLTPSDVKFFYFKEYWEPCKADDLPIGIDYYVFDFTVHSGQGNSIRTLQKVIDAVIDGAIGENTLRKVYNYCEKNGVKRLLKQLDTARRDFLFQTPAGALFKRGMENRLTQVMGKCYNAIEDVYIDDRKPISQSKTINAAKIGTGALAGMEAINVLAPSQDQAQDAVAHLIDNLETVNQVTRLISGLYTYKIEIVLLIVLGFFGYIYFNRIRDYLLGKK